MVPDRHAGRPTGPLPLTRYRPPVGHFYRIKRGDHVFTVENWDLAPEAGAAQCTVKGRRIDEYVAFPCLRIAMQ